MIDLQDKQYRPTLEEIGTYVRNPVFNRFCSELKLKYGIEEQLAYSACSMAPGWNIKFKKSGKSLCTIYPHEAYFTVLVVVGKRQKDAVEELLPHCSERIRSVYEATREWNGQRWLMIDLEDDDGSCQDVFRLIEIRRNS